MSGANTNKDWARASEINDAMLGIQAYADDSMLFIMRYNDRAKRLMRQRDYAEFMDCLKGLMEMWSKPAEAVGGAQARSQKASEKRQRCFDLVKGFPDLERDFDRFVTSSRATLRGFNPSQV